MLSHAHQPGTPDLIGSGRIRLAIASVVGGLLLAACGEAQAPRGIADLTVTPQAIELARHDTVRLNTVVVNEAGEPLSGVAVTFRSNNSALVSVDVFGLVRSLGPLGGTTIAATAAGIQRTVSVTVIGIPGVFTLVPTDTSIRQGGSVQLTATLLDSGGIVIPGATVDFSATGPVTVSNSGLVTSVGPPGEAIVRAIFLPYVIFSHVHVIDSTLLGRVSAVGHPAGVAISRIGTALVTRELAVFLSRLDLPAISVTSQIRVHHGLSAVTFDTTGTRAYVVDPVFGQIGVIDVSTNQQVDSILLTGIPTATVVSRDNQSLFVATSLDTLYRFDRTTKVVTGRFGLPWHVSAMVRHPSNGALLYLALPDSGLVIEFDAAGDSVRRRLPLGGAPSTLAVSPDGTELYAGDIASQAVHFWDVAGNADITSVPVGAAPGGIGVTPDATLIWVSLRSLGLIKALDRTSRTVLRTLNPGGAPRGLGISPIDGTVVVANDSGWIDVMR